MVRKIIHIDEEKCNGCGICADACHEGAIEIIDGKAKLVRENFCDGFGDCLPGCPMGAITFEEREAPAYDAQAVEKAQEEKKMGQMNADNMEAMMHEHHEGGCPGSRMMQFKREDMPAAPGVMPGMAQGMTLGMAPEAAPAAYVKPASCLAQWPCQIKLLPTQAPFFNGAKLLIAADCTAYAYANMHEDFMKGKVTLIGCPKLDAVDYSEKLTEIIRDNDIKSVTIVRMEVPCCGGLQRAAETALRNSGKFIPWQVVTISRDGRILD
ncbi:MAG: 4Fe-4S binding protein [Clostridium sp.]|nr:4Fe-4S binding protein [Clostridium sp.]